jgi:four helix bundle protein
LSGATLEGGSGIEENRKKDPGRYSVTGRARPYTELEAWKESIDLVVACYGLIRRFPAEERYCLGVQIGRAAISIPSNIAEGQSRASVKEFLRHVSFAYGSLAELETQLEIASQLGYIEDEGEFAALVKSCDRVGRMLSGLRQYLNTRAAAGSRR